MVDRKALITRLVRLGITYGPIAYEGLARNRGLFEELTRRPRGGGHEEMAYEHASALIDGSVLGTFDGDTRVWVVFSGDRPVGTHPTVRTSVERLLENHDLSRRVTPDEWIAEAAEYEALSSGGSLLHRRRNRAITAGPIGDRLRRRGPQDTIRGETTSGPATGSGAPDPGHNERPEGPPLS